MSTEHAPRAGSLAGRVASGTLWLGLVNLLSKGSQVLLTVVLAGFLTERELGLVTVAVSLVAVGQVVQSMGVFDVVSRTSGDPERVAGTLMTLSVGVGVLLAAAAVLGRQPIAAALGAPSAAGLVAIAAVSLPFTAAGGVQMGLMHRHLQFRRRMLPDVGSALLGTALTIALAATGAGAASPAIGLLAGAVALPLLGVLAGVRIRPRWDRDAAGETLRWTRVVGPGAVVAVLLANVDYAAVSRTLGPDAVGVYSLAFRIAWAPYLMIALVLGAVSFPVYARLRREGRDLGAAVTRFLRAVLVLAGGPYLVLALAADRVVVLDARWAPAAGVLVVLCGYGLGFVVQYMLLEVVRAVDRPVAYLALQLGHLALLLAGLAVLTRWGVVAAACAQLAAVWLVLPVTLWVLRGSGGSRVAGSGAVVPGGPGAPGAAASGIAASGVAASGSGGSGAAGGPVGVGGGGAVSGAAVSGAAASGPVGSRGAAASVGSGATGGPVGVGGPAGSGAAGRGGRILHRGPLARTVGGLALAAVAGAAAGWALRHLGPLADPASVPGLVLTGVVLTAVYVTVIALTNADLLRELRALRGGADTTPEERS